MLQQPVAERAFSVVNVRHYAKVSISLDGNSRHTRLDLRRCRFRMGCKVLSASGPGDVEARATGSNWTWREALSSPSPRYPYNQSHLEFLVATIEHTGLSMMFGEPAQV